MKMRLMLALSVMTLAACSLQSATQAEVNKLTQQFFDTAGQPGPPWTRAQVFLNNGPPCLDEFVGGNEVISYCSKLNANGDHELTVCGDPDTFICAQPLHVLIESDGGTFWAYPND